MTALTCEAWRLGIENGDGLFLIFGDMGLFVLFFCLANAIDTHMSHVSQGKEPTRGTAMPRYARLIRISWASKARKHTAMTE